MPTVATTFQAYANQVRFLEQKLTKTANKKRREILEYRLDRARELKQATAHETLERLNEITEREKVTA